MSRNEMRAAWRMVLAVWLAGCASPDSPSVGAPDSGASDAALADVGEPDAGGGDAALTDAARLDVGASDASVADAEVGGSIDLGRDAASDDVGSDVADTPAPGQFVIEPASLSVFESGPAVPFTVRLADAPTASVVLDLRTDPAQLTVVPDSVVFAPDTWDVPVSIDLVAVDDDVAEARQTVVLSLAAASVDPRYGGLTADVQIDVRDDDPPRISLSKNALFVSEFGQQDSFTIALRTRPTADVAIGLVNGDPGQVALSVTGVTFTATNWSTPQEVVVTPIDNSRCGSNPPVPLAIEPAVSLDPMYDGLDADDPVVFQQNDDDAFVDLRGVSPTTESGGTSSVTVALTCEPTADVTLDLAVTDSSEATLLNDQLVVTPANWYAGVTATVVGVDDADPDGPQGLYLTAEATSADTHYDGIRARWYFENLDDEPGMTVSWVGMTHESGAATDLTLRLHGPPTVPVTVTLDRVAGTPDMVGDACVGAASTEAAGSPATVTLTQIAESASFRFTGLDDAAADGDQPFFVCASVSAPGDAYYDGFVLHDADGDGAFDPLRGKNFDDETVGLSLDSHAIQVTEGDRIWVPARINALPPAGAAVVLRCVSADPNVVAQPRSVTFDQSAWTRLIEVDAVRNPAVTGTLTTTISCVVDPIATTFDAYDAVQVPDITVEVLDID